jgi:putative ABC transport system substrate-binding protein
MDCVGSEGMRRRDFLAALTAAATAPLAAPPGEAQAQAGRRVHRLGTLNPALPTTETSPFGQALVKALAARGYALGDNLTFSARGASGDLTRLPALLAELKAAGVEVVFGVGYPVAVAAKAAGMPVVMGWGIGDPVATGLIESLAHPGGSVTGISDIAAALTTKRLSLLKEVSPRLARVAMIWNRDDLGMSLRYEASARAARDLGFEVQALGVREPGDFNEAIAAMAASPPDGIIMVADSLTNLNRGRVFEFAAARRLPAIYEYDFLARDGGLMSYGPDIAESIDRAAAMIDRILKGAKPGDLPFEQPTRYPLLINMRTARAIGITIPPQLLALADEVIE